MGLPCRGVRYGLKWRPPPKEPEEASGNIRRHPPIVNDRHEHDRTIRADAAYAPQARRRAAQLREGAGGCPRGVCRRRGVDGAREIARRAGGGIGTLYRHFPNRQALLEALYIDEVEEVCRSAAQLDGADPWDALNDWFERFIAYVATKRALAHELLNYLDPDAPLFQVCRTSLFEAGEPLLKRAQTAGVVRPDVTIAEVIQMVVGIAKIPAGEPGQIEHILRIALDGLRYRPER